MRSAKLRTNSTKVYWTRRARGGSKPSSTVSKRDYNFDGVIDKKDSKVKHLDMIIGLSIGIIIGTILIIYAFISGEGPKPAWKYLV